MFNISKFFGLCILSAIILLAGCAHFQCQETEHFKLFYEPKSPAEKDIETLKAHVENIHHSLNGDNYMPSRKVSYYFHNKYPLRFFGAPVLGYVWNGNVHAVYTENVKEITPHELMHLYLHKMNPKAPFFFEEGTCNIGNYYAFQYAVQGQHFTQIITSHDLIARQKSLPSLKKVIKGFSLLTYGYESWFTPPLPRYEIARSFCQFLYATHGQKYWIFYEQVRPGNFESKMEEVFGKKFVATESEWKAFLGDVKAQNGYEVINELLDNLPAPLESKSKHND